jgi:Xaa-Pro dipeptidase
MRPTASNLSVRLQRFREALDRRRITLAFISNPKTFYYLTGHKPLLSVSPTRPWYLVVPVADPLVACVPSIGVADIQSDNPELAVQAWASPDSGDEGLRLLRRVLAGLAKRGDVIGLELGREMRAVMPIADLDVLRTALPYLSFVDAADAIWETRQVKDHTELAAMRRAIASARHAFAAIAEELRSGISERNAARRFQILALEGGADSIAYLACSSGAGGYPSLTRTATDRTLCAGDIIGFDTGIVVDEMWCDFNRNFAIGDWPDDARHMQETLEAAIRHVAELIKPGVTASFLRRAMEDIVRERGFAPDTSGRWGHGVGLDFTEPPSLTSHDATVLTEGMVITLEPSIAWSAPDASSTRMLVNEEMFLISADGSQRLT